MLKKSIIRVPVKYGFFGSLLSIAVFLLLYFIDRTPLLHNRIPNLIILTLFIYFSIKEYKVYYNLRTLRFWEGMTVGFFTYIMIALISLVFIWIFLKWIDPVLLQEYILDRVSYLEQNKESIMKNLNEESYQRMFRDLEMTSAWDVALDDLLKKVMVGLFLTIVISLVQRKH